MKKFFAIAALFAVAAFSLSSCGNDDPSSKYRIASFADDWDTWVYSYDDAGKLVSIVRGENDRVYEFQYKAPGVVIKYTKGGEAKNDITLTLNDNGLCTKFVDEYGDEFTYTYDANGYVTSVKKFDELKANVVIENGNIAKWSKFENGAEVWKVHTYGAADNVNGIHNIYAEFGAGRFLRETGLFGKGTAKLCTVNQWDKEGGTPSELNYEYDDNGNIVKEIKTFPNKPDSKAENYFYTWEENK